MSKMKFKATVHIFIKRAVLNPEEKPTQQQLARMGLSSITAIRMGKCHILEIETDDVNSVQSTVEEACAKLLTNPVTEEFRIEKIEPVTAK